MRFLHLEDDSHDAELIHTLIRKEWPECEIERLETRDTFERALGNQVDLILSDFSLPSFDGLSALSIVRQRRPGTPFIFISGTIGEELAVQALKNGAIDYVLKDRMSRLIPAMHRALAESRDHMRRREIEDALRESQERFQQITENVADLIAVLDAQGRRVYNNPAYKNLLGDPNALRGSDSFQDIHPEDRDRIKSLFQETVRTGVGKRAEYRFLLRDGTVRYIESQGSVIRDAQGAVSNVLVVSRDVTERRKAEERMREQASLLDKARDAIFVSDLNQRISYWNASAESLFGWTATEAMGQSVQGLLFPQDTFRVTEVMDELISAGQWQGELRPQTKTGRSVVVESRWTLVTDAVGTPKSILLINTDITERKKLEVQFLRAQRMESIGTLAGGIAHDLNNVLTPILVAAQVLQPHVRTPEDRQLLETIEKSALHGASLIKQVLLFARGAEGEHVALQVRHLITDMEKMLRETLPRSITIQTMVDRELSLVKGDSTQLSQVLMNLCVNARDAMVTGGEIAIAAKNTMVSSELARVLPGCRPGPHVMISVEDTGSGIPAEYLDRIFDPFFTTKELGKGTGLGLSTVLGIVKGHGGAVRVHSQLGQGTRFEIYLPAVATEERAVARDSRAPLPRGNGEGVLVIDDESFIRDVVGAMLRHCGYREFLAESGEAGLELYRNRRDQIQLALVDMMMPGMDGAATVAELRQLEPQLPIIVVSGMLENDQVGAAGVIANVDLLRKPITAEALLTKIADTLAKSADSHESSHPLNT